MLTVCLNLPLVASKMHHSWPIIGLLRRSFPWAEIECRQCRRFLTAAQGHWSQCRIQPE